MSALRRHSRETHIHHKHAQHTHAYTHTHTHTQAHTHTHKHTDTHTPYKMHHHTQTPLAHTHTHTSHTVTDERTPNTKQQHAYLAMLNDRRGTRGTDATRDRGSFARGGIVNGVMCVAALHLRYQSCTRATLSPLCTSPSPLLLTLPPRTSSDPFTCAHNNDHRTCGVLSMCLPVFVFSFFFCWVLKFVAWRDMYAVCSRAGCARVLCSTRSRVASASSCCTCGASGRKNTPTIRRAVQACVPNQKSASMKRIKLN